MTTRAMPWFRMYVDFLNDPKIITLAHEDQRHFVGVLALKCAGVIDQSCAPELLNRIVAQRLWIDHSAIVEVKKRLVGAGLIDEDWQPLAWDKRQFRSDADPTGAERQRRFKEKKRTEAIAALPASVGNGDGNGGNALPNASANAGVTPPDTEADTEAEKKHIPPDGGAPPAGGASVSGDDEEDGTRKKPLTKAWLVREGIKAQHAADWLTARRAKHLPLTLTAWEGVCNEAEKASLTPAQAVHMCATFSWAGFKAKWLTQEEAKSGGAWWTSEILALAKALQVGAGPARRGETNDQWHARIRAAIDNGGAPPAPRPQAVTPLDPIPVPVRPADAPQGPSDVSRAASAAMKDLLKKQSFGGVPA